MMEEMRLTIRFSPEEISMIREIMENGDFESHAAVVRAGIHALYKKRVPKLCLGYIEVDRPGDLQAETDDCVECGQPLPWPYFIAVMEGGSVHGPLCGTCAVTEE